MAALLTTLGTVAGTVAGGPAGGAVGGGLGSALTNLFGGPARDASRQQNVDWYAAAALQGSVIAARVIIAAPDNVASNEDPMWIAARAKVQAQRPDVLAAASNAGGLWQNGTVQLVQQELQAIAQTTNLTQAQPSPAQNAQVLAGMTTLAKAPSKLSPLVIGILVAGAVLVFVLATTGRKH
jgi:ABC-type antimicrobial peptide transport system permease subunit